MENSNENIRKRLKDVRVKIFNEGVKLSAAQFAYILNTSENKIRNYELGRSSIPIELLAKLYYKGIDPVYILTGDGSVFAKNQAGDSLKGRIEDAYAYTSRIQYAREPEPAEYKSKDFDPSLLSDEDKIHQISAVAGDILKYIRKKKKKD
jgi:transcriptional regulator with XRE-family HTH domain